MSSSLTVTTSTRGPVTVLAVRGELDTFNAGHLARRAALALVGNGRLLVDLSGLAFTDCHGARTISAVVRAACPPAALQAPRPSVRRVLELVGDPAPLTVPYTAPFTALARRRRWRRPRTVGRRGAPSALSARARLDARPFRRIAWLA